MYKCLHYTISIPMEQLKLDPSWPNNINNTSMNDWYVNSIWCNHGLFAWIYADNRLHTESRALSLNGKPAQLTDSAAHRTVYYTAYLVIFVSMFLYF